MEEELCCLMCYEILDSPITFPCQSHSVCKQPCFKQLYDRERGRLKTLAPIDIASDNSDIDNDIDTTSTIDIIAYVACPVCGTGSAPIPVSPHHKVEVNKALARIISLHIQDESSSDEEPDDEGDISPARCEACKQPAVVECLACGCALCSFHDKIIHSAGVLTRHPRVPIQQASCNKPRPSWFCDEHKGKLKEFFCVNDNTFVCSTCLLSGSHTSHPYKGVNDTVQMFKKQMLSNKILLEQKLRAKTSLVEEVNNIRNDIYQNQSLLYERVESKIGDLQQLLYQKKATLRREIDELTREKLDTINPYSDEINMVIHGIESGISSIMKLVVMAESVADLHGVFDFVAEAVELEKVTSRFSSSQAPISHMLKFYENTCPDIHIDELITLISELSLFKFPNTGSSLPKPITPKVDIALNRKLTFDDGRDNVQCFDEEELKELVADIETKISQADTIADAVTSVPPSDRVASPTPPLSIISLPSSVPPMQRIPRPQTSLSTGGKRSQNFAFVKIRESLPPSPAYVSRSSVTGSPYSSPTRRTPSQYGDASLRSSTPASASTRTTSVKRN